MNIELDEYEITNLRWALELIAEHPKLGILNSGDWVRQIWFKLPDIGCPNVPKENALKILNKDPK